MTRGSQTMKVTIDNRGPDLRERLRERLERTALLRCAEHGQPVLAISIHGRENGWFDSMLTTCCETLRAQAAAIVRDRC